MTPRRFRSQADLFAAHQDCALRDFLLALSSLLRPNANRWRVERLSPQCSRRGPARIRRTSGFFMSAVENFSSTLNEPAGVVRWPTSLIGVNVGAAIHA